MRVLGVDPGYERLGVAVLERAKGAREQYVFSDCIRTSATDTFTERLRLIGESFNEILSSYTPDAVALETLYVTKNQKTAMHVSEVRGVLLFLSASRHIPVFEYTPHQIKAAVTSDGRGGKTAVETMVRRLVTIPKPILLDDEFDAIAIALTAFASEPTLR